MDYIKCFEREGIKKEILDFLEYFYNNKHRTDIHRSLYLYGEHGIGKSEFIKDTLDKNTYNLICMGVCMVFFYIFLHWFVFFCIHYWKLQITHKRSSLSLFRNAKGW